MATDNHHPKPPPLRVRFHDPDDFARELRARDPDVEAIVRLTYRWRSDPRGMPLRHLTLVAGFLRRARGALVLCELAYYAGDVWDGMQDGASARTLSRARAAYDAVARAAEERGMALAGGAYEIAAERAAA